MAEGTQEPQLQLNKHDLGVLKKVVAEIQEETGCEIKLPPEGATGSKLIAVPLFGSPEQVRRARDVVDGVLCGEAVKDVFARQKGAQILKDLDDATVAYITERRTALEAEHGMTLEIGDHWVHIYSQTGSALAAREALEQAIAHLREAVTELFVLPKRFTQAMVRQLREDMTLRHLLDSVRPRVEDTVTKSDEGTAIHLRGTRRRVAEVRALLERLCQGGGTDFISLCPGLLAQMSEAAAASLEQDLGYLGRESGATVEAQWDCDRMVLSGETRPVAFARGKLREILQFHFPEHFASVWVPPEFERLNKELLRLHRSRSGPLDVHLDEQTGLVWLSGEAGAVEHARRQLLETLRRGGMHEQLATLKGRQLEGEAGRQLRQLQELLNALWTAAPDQEASESIATSIAWFSLEEASRSLAITGSKEAVARAKCEAQTVLGSEAARRGEPSGEDRA